jgi:hypothetical protein
MQIIVRPQTVSGASLFKDFFPQAGVRRDCVPKVFLSVLNLIN